jgi:uncharacterized protein YjiS (DUF1127 family)
MSDTTFNIVAYPRATRRVRAPVPAPSKLQRLAAWASEAVRRRRSRRAISGLDERMLRDIGVSFAEAETEANKPWWRA